MSPRTSLSCSLYLRVMVEIPKIAYQLTLSVLQTNTHTFANSVAPDETARNAPYELSRQDLHRLPFYFFLN